MKHSFKTIRRRLRRAARRKARGGGPQGKPAAKGAASWMRRNDRSSNQTNKGGPKP